MTAHPHHEHHHELIAERTAAFQARGSTRTAKREAGKQAVGTLATRLHEKLHAD